MSIRLTEEQSEAIGRRGSVIVSASAGSGKTFVMIRRLISLILGGEDVRHILAVTFTKKAAAQMRDKLRGALLEGIAQHTGGERDRLKAQLAALPLAEISTIHAFCGHLVRSYFFKAGVDPAFRILPASDAEGMQLRARAMESALEDAYRKGEEGFLRLLAVYFRKGSDKDLTRVLSALYDRVCNMPDPERAIADMGASDLFEEACACLLEEHRARLRELARVLDNLVHGYGEYDARLVKCAQETLDAIDSCIAQEDVYALRAHIAALSFGKRPQQKSVPGEAMPLYDGIAAARGGIRGLLKKLAQYGSCEEERARCEDARTYAAALGQLLAAFDAAYAREKAEAGVLDLNDLEHFALRLLADEGVRADLAQRYRVVFVDEYQDVNPVQAEIVSRLSGEECFLVGDAKQAIYGFRGSRSRYFSEQAAAMEGSLRLSENFRSAPAVLEAVNLVFGSVIDGYEPMRGGSRYGQHRGEVLFHILSGEKQSPPPPEEVYSVLAHTAREAHDPVGERVARLVAEELDRTWFDVDRGCEKRVTFGDIAILIRKRGEVASAIVRALGERGIPVSTAAGVNLFDFFEARLMLDWLSFLDEPEQDIPYASALLSVAGGMTEEELCAVRLSPEGKASPTFRAACAAYRLAYPDSPAAKKLAAFAERAQELRVHAAVRTAAEVMNELLALGLEAQIAAADGGRARLSRIRRLVAEGQDVSVNTLLARLKAMNYVLPYAEGAGENAVQILTMHASKGLEFPVVILAGFDGKLRLPDEKEEVVWTERFLAAPKSYDRAAKTASTTFVRRAALALRAAEERQQTCNVLYVGMTRAKYRLHLVFGALPQAFSPVYANTGGAFFDMQACAPLVAPAPEEEAPALPRRALVYRPDDALTSAVLSVYGQPYAFEESTRLRVKSSATALLRAGEGRYFGDPSAEDAPFERRTGREEGVAYHTFLQHVRYGEDAASEAERMVREGELTPEQAALLDVEELRAILAIPCLARLKGRRVLREQSFLVRLPASALTEGAPAEEVIYQGAIDLLAEDGAGCELIDYKYSSLSDEALAAKYAVQIALYKKAAAAALGVREEAIRAEIVNIARRRTIAM